MDPNRKRSSSQPDLNAKRHRNMETENERASSKINGAPTPHQSAQELSQSLQEMVGALSVRMQALEDENSKLYEKVDTLSGRVQALEDENSILCEKVDALSTEVNGLEEKMRKDEAAHSLAYTVNVFQMAICWHVFPPIYMEDKRTSSVQDLHDYVHGINSIPDYLVEFVDESDKSEYRQRWEDVCKQLGWKNRWEPQHPPSDLEKIRLLSNASEKKLVVLQEPLEIDQMVKMVDEFKGWPQHKKVLLKHFMQEFPLKLERCGLNYRNTKYYF